MILVARISITVYDIDIAILGFGKRTNYLLIPILIGPLSLTNLQLLLEYAYTNCHEKAFCLDQISLKSLPAKSFHQITWKDFLSWGLQKTFKSDFSIIRSESVVFNRQ